MSEATITKRGRKAANVETEKRVVVSASLTKETHEKLSELRWANRIDTIGELVRLAVDEYIAKHTVTDEPQSAA
jgi:hypothetical protein